MRSDGIPPNLAHEAGRYQAIDDAFARQANGGQVPASPAAQAAVPAELTKARCPAAKALGCSLTRLGAVSLWVG